MNNIPGTTWLKIGISLLAIMGIVVRLIWPQLKIDTIALGLLIVAVLPWLSSILESARMPGGWEVRFRDLQQAASQVTAGSDTKVTDNAEPWFVTTASKDANLALVGLRIEIEKRLCKLATKHDVPDRQPLSKIFEELKATLRGQF